MRIISMVPSWTETLIEAGVEVVGRTRFCIHPAGKVHHIPIVGGTKNLNAEIITTLNADFILLDQEENPKSFLDKVAVPFHATHVESAHDISHELFAMGNVFKNQNLFKMSLDWNKLLNGFKPQKIDHRNFPGLLDWWIKPDKNLEKIPIVYMIWKKPWMCVGQSTFIASLFELIGLPLYFSSDWTKYPSVELESIPPKSLLLFSSEPYPFANDRTSLIETCQRLGFSAALIDGESFGWFGVRSYNFLRNLKLSAK